MRRYPEPLPRWRLRLPGLLTEYRTVARIRRCAPPSGNTPPAALTLTGATNRLPNRSPDKALCAAIRVFSPVALTLTGATNRLPNRSPDKALCAAIREPPRWRLRLAGLPTDYQTVARIRRYAPLSGNLPGGAYAYRGYRRLPNRNPDKALRAAIREPSPGSAYAYRGY